MSMIDLFPWWKRYPNVNDEIQNLDWLLYTVKHLSNEVSNFINLNTIKYADPILWDITSQYEANTIVVDPQTGDAFISTRAVPYGVSLNNTDYWTKIYNYADAINGLEEQIAAANEGLSTTASSPRSTGEFVWLNGLLYVVTNAMIAGDSYVIGSNIEKITIEEIIGNLVLLNTTDKSSIVAALNEVIGNIGNLATLNTTDKLNLVHAINEVLGNIGNLATLNTTDKQNCVHAINEVLGNIGNLTTLNTTDKQNCVHAINEVLGNIGNLSSLNTTDKQNCVHAINEVLGNIGNLTTLKTTDKQNAVHAINEVYDNLSLVRNRKYIFIGDSYNDAAYMDWANKIISLMGLTLGTNAFVASQGGTGFLWEDSVTPGNGFLTLLTSLYNNIPDRDTITDIIVLGGANDITATSNTADINSAILNFLTYCQTNYPNAKVGIGFIGRYLGEDGVRTYANYIDAMYRYRQTAMAYGNGYYMAISDIASHGQASYMLDHVHPNGTAGILFARCIASYLIGQTASFMYNLSFSDASGFAGEFSILDNNIHLHISGLPAVANGTPVNGYGKYSTMTQIGTQNYLYFNRPVFFRLQANNGGTFYIAWIKLLYDKIYLGVENNALGNISANSLNLFVGSDALTIDLNSMIVA